MARGPYYTPEEDRALLALYEDNKGKQYIMIAKLAQKYGLCTNRTPEALAQHLSALINPPEEKDEEPDANDLTTLIYENKYKEVKQKYEELMGAIFNNATLAPNGEDGIYLNLPKLLRHLYIHEPERVNATIEALKIQRKE